MSSVYVVEHKLLLKRFALKVLHPFYAKRADFADRVRVEAQTIAGLRHTNVVDVVDFWISKDGVPCLVLELLNGHSLAREIATCGRLPSTEATGYACQALRGLAAAHRLGVVHRDVKPENLFLHNAPERGIVLKVLDFGIARVLPGASDAAPSPSAVPTETGAIVGSPRFMSPEAARGERVGAQADIYSLGLVLYLMLVGEEAFAGGSRRRDPPSRYVGTITADLDRLVLRAIQQSPELRYPSADAFREDLERHCPPDN